ncbi:hypothetical protein ABPG72_021728 [Tetrahymena utriculariae]
MEEFLDISTIREQAIIMGNGAHELRNFFAITKKNDLPELIAIDTLAAQVENQSRQFVQISLNPANLLKPETGKNILRSIYRTNNFFLRNLKLDIKQLGYSLMSKEMLGQIIENIELQQKIVKNLDKQLNAVFNNYLDQDIEEVQMVADQFKDVQLYKQLNYNLDLSLAKSLEHLNLENLVDTAKSTCNKAHSIQNAICTYQTIEKVKNPANQINNLSGNIENQFRTILQAFGQQTNNPNGVKQVIQNQTKAAIEQINQIANHQKSISAFYPQEMKYIQEACDQIMLSISYFQEIAESKIVEVLS